ncbi:MAG: type VI secretion system tip protein TssI/VgrG [Pirellulaceae bacterium]|nr:type VI secretion system tip protein TssI/VgrG [Pirellulaceae bacterium]
MPKAITITSPLGPDKLIFSHFSGWEELGRPFEFKLHVYSEDAAIKLDKVLGQNLTIAIEYPDKRKRHFNGEVIQFRQITETKEKFFQYEAILRPKLWYLTYTRDCRIFQQKTVPDIIKLVLDDHGLTDVKKSLTKTYNAREYCVQYNESDFDFVSRLMEEEGIYYFFEHAADKHTLVLADDPSAHKPLEGEAKVPFMLKRQGYSNDHIFDWHLIQEVHSGIYAQTDYDFEKPKADLLASSKILRTHGQADLEVFNYPGTYTEKPNGQASARTRIEELQTPWEVVTGSTNAVQMGAGSLFTLDAYPRKDQNREHLLVRTEYTLKLETDTAAGKSSDGVQAVIGIYFGCQFRAISSQRPFRSACLTPKPVVKGPQTALVVGKAGEEIWTDKYGRVKVQFFWDRYGKKDENSSCWLRVAQVWAGKTWGAMHIPRIGQEVIVDFLEGNPDQPIITGRVYNADQTVPYALPTNQTQSGLKSRSTKEGDAEKFNELRFEDKKGEEQVYFHAEKNFDRIVENNDTLKVGFEKKDKGNQTIDIYNDRTVTLDQGNDTLTIKKGNQSVTIQAGNQTILIEKGKCSIEAKQEILLKVGGSTITIKPAAIEIKSTNIKIEASGKLDATAPKTTVNGSGNLTLTGGVVKIN